MIEKHFKGPKQGYEVYRTHLMTSFAWRWDSTGVFGEGNSMFPDVCFVVSEIDVDSHLRQPRFARLGRRENEVWVPPLARHVLGGDLDIRDVNLEIIDDRRRCYMNSLIRVRRERAP